MAKDFFQDIAPPDDDRRPLAAPRPAPAAEAPMHEEEHDDEVSRVPIRVGGAEPRGIRSIMPSRTQRSRMDGDMRTPPPPISGMGGMPASSPSHRSRWWLWGVALLGVVILAALALLAFRSTTVTVTPRSHTIQLTSATSFTAYPESSAASGTLAYSVQTLDLQDSAVVPVSGTTTSAAAKASGSITVYNNYSASPVRLVKTTRFQTPDGLIFRAPADIVVPAKKGSTAGSVSVTVVADQTGEQYNVGPVSKFTLPGAKSNAAMYAGVYARSAAAMTGGSSGVSGPGVDPAVDAAAVAQLQSELKAKAVASVAQSSDGTIALPDLMQITYTRGANTPEAGGQARIQESAHALIPVFNTIALGQVVGSAVSADSDNAAVTITPQSGFAAQLFGKQASLGTDPLQFTLTGQALLVWQVDTGALAQALAGRDEGAFQTVIGGFSGISEAHARIEPFWKSTFPSKASDIKVVLTAPVASQ